MVAIDTETSGLDLLNGCGPFFVTTCAEGDTAMFYEWDVDPLTRRIKPDPQDVKEIQRIVTLAANWGKDTPPDMQERHALVLHNARFDVRALEGIGIKGWPWHMTRDTLMAAHLLDSSQPKDLTSIATKYLNINIKGREDALEKAVKWCMNYCRRHLPNWRIATHDGANIPSGGDWHCDYWLPHTWVKYQWEISEACNSMRELGIRNRYPEGETLKHLRNRPGWEFRPDGTADDDDKGHPYWTILSDYATADSEMTLCCWQVMSGELRRKGLWNIFLERMKLLPVVHGMEVRGVTYLGSKMDEAEVEIRCRCEEAEAACVGIASGMGVDLPMPRGSASNDALKSFLFDTLQLPVIKKTEKGNNSMDEEVFDYWMDTLPQNSVGRAFVGNLIAKRKAGKLLTDVSGYKRYRLPTKHPGVYTLHPDINPTGGATLRYSFKRPNTANVAVGDDDDTFTMRHVYGPAPGRVWVRADYENIELRIPGYDSGEEAMIELFEKPDDPPYFGSYHLLNASIIYSDLFWPMANEKGAFKSRHKVAYGKTKNFGFAKQYGAGRDKADRTAGVRGAYDMVGAKLPKMNALNKRQIEHANRYGYVETMIDKTVDPKRGYPIMCGRNEFGRVSPTLPLSYRVQSTAMWCTSKAMVRCDDQLQAWSREEGEGYYITLQVHDELVFDLPDRGDEDELVAKTNILRGLMVQSGDDIGVPLKVSATLHREHWGTGVTVPELGNLTAV